MKKTVVLKSFTQDEALRAGDFVLMPVNPQRPIVTSQPIKNFIQTTWIEGVQNGIVKYQNIKPLFNTVNVLEGTNFSFSFNTLDPSNVNDFTSTTNLSYVWKKDDSQLYNLNRLNNGNGVSGILISGSNSVSGLSGRYICEISNAFGTTETEPIDINIIDPLKHPKLYKNLLLNGDGEGGLDGWQGSTDILVSPFVGDNGYFFNGANKSLSGDLIIWSKDYHNDPNKTDINESLTSPIDKPQSFFFTTAPSGFLFYPYYKLRAQTDPNFFNSNIKSRSTNIDGLTKWLSEDMIQNIVVNEDYLMYNAGRQPAAFFPGIAWMDSWNKNNKFPVLGLTSEFNGYTNTYFTRDKLKFVKFDGKPNASMTQTIDLTEAADIIDGMVYGVKYATSQFFAYVGAGITGYKIRLTTTEGVQTFNYFIADAEHLYDRYYQEVNDAFPEVRQKKLGDRKYKLLPESDIEIIPIVDDQTTITLEYFDDLGRLLKTENIKGPDESDVWAIKEKVYFPLTLLPLFLFVQPNNNPIKVFGQKYTDTNSLLPLFIDPSSGKGLLADIANKTTPAGIKDIVAKFLMNKFEFPTNYVPYGSVDKIAGRSLTEQGAAAMFGVGKDVVIPYKTRSVNVTVNFSHKSEIIYDSNPELKGWNKDTIYSNELGQSTGVSKRLAEYGYPRCGITKMKFLVAPNNIEISEKYATYSIPPSNYTVLGLQKAKYKVPSAFDSSDTSKTFDYEKQYLVTLPQIPNIIPLPTPLVRSENLAAYIEDLNKRSIQNTANIPDTPNPMGSNDQLNYIESL